VSKHIGISYFNGNQQTTAKVLVRLNETMQSGSTASSQAWMIGVKKAASRTRRTFMKKRGRKLLVIALAVAGFASQALAQTKIPVGGIVYNYVGHVYINPETGVGEVAGYFASIAGIDSPFQGTPSEATAMFTYRSDPLHFNALPADVDTAITILNAGKWHIYFNTNPSGNWNDPSSFSQGQLIANLDHNALELITSGPTHHGIFSGELLESFDFSIGGTIMNFRRSFPGGIKNLSVATNTVVFGSPDFPIAFADAGWAVAKGHTDGKLQ
jgi:hypothetical protein